MHLFVDLGATASKRSRDLAYIEYFVQLFVVLGATVLFILRSCCQISVAVVIMQMGLYNATWGFQASGTHTPTLLLHSRGPVKYQAA